MLKFRSKGCLAERPGRALTFVLHISAAHIAGDANITLITGLALNTVDMLLVLTWLLLA